MEKEIFKGAVQYGDWKGSVAADNADLKDMQITLQERGLIPEGHALIGVKFNSHLNGGKPSVGITVRCALPDDIAMATTGGTPILAVRAEVVISADEFLSMFKRFSLSLSRKGEYEDKELSTFSGSTP